MMRLFFISHSGFLLETEGHYLLFDYFQGGIPPMTENKPIYVFASHGHYDHFSEEIFGLSELYGRQRVQYVLSADIGELEEEKARLGKQLCFLGPHEEMQFSDSFGGIKIETLRSNDSGLAYLISADKKRIYHAGDLQLWDWPGEPEADNRFYRESYLSELSYLSEKICGTQAADLAMLVLDGRQEGSAFLGMDAFLERIRTRYAVPMHSFGRYAVNEAYRAHFAKLKAAGRIPEETVYLPAQAEKQEFLLSDS